MRREAASSLRGDIFSYGWEIGITTAGLIVAAALYYKRMNRDCEVRVIPTSDIKQQVMTASTDSFFDKNAQIEKAIFEIQLPDTGLLSLELIKAIYTKSLDIIEDEYVKFTREIRKRRRLIRKINEDQYMHMVLDYEIKVKDLIERGREELAIALDISKQRYQDSIFQIQNQGEREAYYQIDQSSRNQIKDKMLKKRRLSDKTAKQILNQQLKFLKSKLYQRYQQTLKKQNVNQAGILAVIHTIIEDFIYQKYGFEEQHLILKRMDKGFSDLEEVKCLVDALEDQQDILMAEIVGCVEPDTRENDYE